MKGSTLVDLTILRTRFTITREGGIQYYFVDGEQVTINEYLKRVVKARKALESD